MKKARVRAIEHTKTIDASTQQENIQDSPYHGYQLSSLFKFPPCATIGHHCANPFNIAVVSHVRHAIA